MKAVKCEDWNEKIVQLGNEKVLLRYAKQDGHDPDIRDEYVEKLLNQDYRAVIAGCFVNAGEMPGWYCLIYLRDKKDSLKLLSANRYFVYEGTNNTFDVLYSTGGPDPVFDELQQVFC